ncbi:MAG: site-2 protease family protein, partial [Sediminibacterium sp.]|nr:site-2 protease family protein [Sediminibacterium sp.]
AWQRLIIMLGGVIVNILLAIGIFIMIVYIWGTSYLPTENVKLGIAGTELALQNGFKEGDKLISVNNIPQLKFDDFERKILDKSANTIEVLRNNKIEIIPISGSLKNKLGKDKNMPLFFPHTLLVIDSISKKTKFGYNAIALQKGDTILSIDNKLTTDILQFNQLKKNYTDVFVPLKVKRLSDTFTTTIYADSKSILHLTFESYFDKLDFSKEHYSFVASVPTGFDICKHTLKQYVSSLGDIFTGKINPNESLGSIISIGKTFPDKFDWERFWTLTAIFSIILAFMNVLPIPALDGGHALFIFIELITRKKPSDKFMERAQVVGMILLMSLMVYALGLDFWRLFK